jgi:FkbM family methyltransferase
VGTIVAFQNFKPILKMGSPLSSVKLLLAAATSSRPKYRALWRAALRPFVRHGEFSVRYRCYERFYRTMLRMSDLNSDFLSARELALGDTYCLDRSFRPTRVLDGGGNTGLFTLRVAAMTEAGAVPPKIIVCEPLPRNIEQIQKHLAMNGVEAEIRPYCLGGRRRTIPFYCRAANQSSFDEAEPYDRVLEIDVILLEDVIGTGEGSGAEERILIKLDIEGMEVEALQAFVPTEQRAVYVVGELHDVQRNAGGMERLFAEHGWTFELFATDTHTSNFRACSPAAVPLLSWAHRIEAVEV